MSGVNWEALTRKPDKVLRPWMADDEMDAILDAAYQELVQGFKRTAPMGKGGPYGISPLDRQPAVLREIEELIRHPERFRGDDDDPSGKPTKRSKKPQKGAKKGGASAQAPGARGSDGAGSTKDLLAKANYFVSSALDAKKVAARRRSTVKACYMLDSIKYDPGPRKGPAVFNMSAAEYQRFLARMAQKGVNIDALLRYQRDRGDYLYDRDDDRDGGEPDAEEADEDEVEYAEEAKNEQPPATEAAPIAAAAPEDGADAGAAAPGAAAVVLVPDASTVQLPSIRGATPTRPGTAPSAPAPTLDTITGGLFKEPPRPASAAGSARPGSKKDRKTDDMSVAGSTISGGAGAGSVRRPATSGGSRPSSSSGGGGGGTGWLKVQGTGAAAGQPDDEVKKLPPRPATAAPAPAPAPAPAAAAAAPPRMTISREGDFSLFDAVPAASSVGLDLGESDEESEPLFKDLSTVRPHDRPASGTHALAGKKTGNARVLSHKRINELKSLRELMMTASGSITTNVHPETSAEANEENKRMRQVTLRCIQDCMDRNRADNAGPLLFTPGYYEAIGPESFYKSDTKQGFVYSDRMKAATEAADVSHGIKMDPLRLWIENAAKNKQKIFQSGGAMKFN